MAYFNHAFNKHLKNNQILAQALVPKMKESGYGRIINIISTSVKQPLNGLGVSNTIRGVYAGGSHPAFVNVMQYITIASTGNATDYGDLMQALGGQSANSNGQGGLTGG